MFQKLIEKIVTKRMDAIEARIDNLLQGAVESAVERALSSRKIVRHEDLNLALIPVKEGLLTEDKVKELARAEVESVVEDGVQAALDDLPATDSILTRDDFDPQDYDLLTKESFDPDDFDIVTKDALGELVEEHIDVDEITSQVIEKIQEALGSIK